MMGSGAGMAGADASGGAGASLVETGAGSSTSAVHRKLELLPLSSHFHEIS